MSKYLVAYIDEEQQEREAFELYFDEYKNEFEVVCIVPGGKTITQIVDEIIEADPDIIVLDFNLKYSDNTVKDNGDIVMQRINDRKPLLPVVLLTSYMQTAKKSFIPPEKRNSIFDKSKLNDPKNSEFKSELINYIIYSQQLLAKYKSEFAELAQKNNSSQETQARLMELDIILEGAVDRQFAIKSTHKTDENLTDLQELIASTKELIQEFKKD